MPSPLRGGWESQNLYEPTFHIYFQEIVVPGGGGMTVSMVSS